MAVINVPGKLNGKIMKAVTKDYGDESAKTNVIVLDTLKDGIKVANIKVDGKDNIINVPDQSYDDTEVWKKLNLILTAIDFDEETKSIKSFRMKDASVPELIYDCYVDGGEFTLSAYEPAMDVKNINADYTHAEYVEVK